MSVFREHKTIADRAASDRSRHREKIDKAIKESIKDVVAEESIIGQSGKKKIRIPVKGIKEHRFVYGSNEKNKQVGSAQGKDVSRDKGLDTVAEENKTSLVRATSPVISLVKKCTKLRCPWRNLQDIFLAI